MKVCTKCGVQKPFSEFNKRTISKDGYRANCRSCQSSTQRKHYNDNKDSIKDYQLRHKYGISLSEYVNKLAEQNGKCCICGREECSSGKRFAVDHNHKTGEVRGLLCHECNRALGMLGDSVEVLQRAVSYLTNQGSYGGKDDIHPAAT